MDPAQIDVVLLEYVRGLVRPDLRPELRVDTPLFNGALDSIALVDLIAFIERRYGRRVANADVIAANFGSVSVLSRFVTR
jgi:acyl carrier protein